MSNQTNLPLTAYAPEAYGFVNEQGADRRALLMRKHERLVLVQHGFELWSGQCKLEDPDYNIQEGAALLKEDVKATSGQKWLIDKSLLRPFTASKKRFIAVLERTGLRFMGGYVVPAEQWNGIKQLLDKEVEVFNLCRSQFLSHYEANVRKWALSHPKMQQSLELSAPPLAEVEGKISAGYVGVRLNPATAEEAPMLEKKVEGLSGQLVLETVQAAKLFVKWSLKEGNNIRSFKQLEIICQKMRGLSFIANGALPLSQLLESELEKLRGKEGKVINSPETFKRLMAITAVLLDKEILTEILQGRMEIAEVRRRFGMSVPVPVVETKEESVTSKVEPATAKAAKPVEKSVSVEKPMPDFALDGGSAETMEVEIDPALEAYFNKHSAKAVDPAPQSPAVEQAIPEEKEDPKPLYVPSDKPAKLSALYW